MKLLTRFRDWLIHRLGGYTSGDLKCGLYTTFPFAFRVHVAAACRKVATDPSFKSYEGSNLGRNILRDEACEWAKLYLKDAGVRYRDSDVHLACELYVHLFLRGIGKTII